MMLLSLSDVWQESGGQIGQRSARRARPEVQLEMIPDSRLFTALSRHGVRSLMVRAMYLQIRSRWINSI